MDSSKSVRLFLPWKRTDLRLGRSISIPDRRLALYITSFVNLNKKSSTYVYTLMILKLEHRRQSNDVTSTIHQFWEMKTKMVALDCLEWLNIYLFVLSIFFWESSISYKTMLQYFPHSDWWNFGIPWSRWE